MLPRKNLTFTKDFRFTAEPTKSLEKAEKIPNFKQGNSLLKSNQGNPKNQGMEGQGWCTLVRFFVPSFSCFCALVTSFWFLGSTLTLQPLVFWKKARVGGSGRFAVEGKGIRWSVCLESVPGTVWGRIPGHPGRPDLIYMCAIPHRLDRMSAGQTGHFPRNKWDTSTARL